MHKSFGIDWGILHDKGKVMQQKSSSEHRSADSNPKVRLQVKCADLVKRFLFQVNEYLSNFTRKRKIASIRNPCGDVTYNRKKGRILLWSRKYFMKTEVYTNYSGKNINCLFSGFVK